jgi:DNA-binding transcriptional LysR family regulator
VTEVSDLGAVTRSGVSWALRRLEAETGAPLLRRSGRALGMTHAGTVFKRHADALLHPLDDGIAAASQLIEPETGPWHSPLAVGTLWVALMNACCGRKPRVTGSSVRNVSSAFSAGHPLDGSLSARDDRQISGS